jgi:hypothetical protein
MALWTKKFVCSLLIFCLGGVGPLIYTNPLSSHQGVKIFSIAIFEPPLDLSALAALRGAAPNQILSRLLAQRFAAQADFISPQPLVPSLVRIFQSDLSHSSLLPPGYSLLLLLCLTRPPLAAPVSGRSAHLPPPDKPPIFLG